MLGLDNMKKSLVLGVTSLGGGVNSVGHHYYANEIKKIGDESGSDHVVVVGHGVDGKTAGKDSVVGKTWGNVRKPNPAKRKFTGSPKISESPMPVDEKLKFAKAFSPKVNWDKTTPERGLGEILGDHAKNYSKIHIHVEPSQAKVLRATADGMVRAGQINHGQVEVHDFHRISNSSGEQINGTAMRNMIIDGDKKKFTSQLPPAPTNDPKIHQRLWDRLKHHMGLVKDKPESQESTLLRFKQWLAENKYTK